MPIPKNSCPQHFRGLPPFATVASDPKAVRNTRTDTEIVFWRHDVSLKQTAPIIVYGDGENPIHHRSHLELLAQRLPRGTERTRGSAMIEASLGLFSLAIFAAYAVDAYRTR